ncbi:MAG: outer membrane protein assembly factor BamA [Methylacidiphilales bacterium]|nr:outer membrane protein assembly factor BamA [Candidatus Methylacidiphilales bacterium]
MRLIFLTISLICVLNPAFSNAESFEYNSIVYRGNVRIPTSYLETLVGLPKRGVINKQSLGSLIQKLYSLKYFEDIIIKHENSILYIELQERPTIVGVEIKGNSLIETKILEENLKNAQIAKGEIFNKSILEVIGKEIKKAYYNEGRYNAKVDLEITDIGQGGKKIIIQITEGDPAIIKRINIIGNKNYTKSNLLELFSLQVADILDPANKNNRYSKRKLEGDIEALKSWYLDNGFLRFKIKSTIVTLTPERDGLEISITLFEGDRYTVESVDAILINYESSEFSINDLHRFIYIKNKTYFSQRLLTLSTNAINSLLSDMGFAYSETKYTSILDESSKSVRLKIIVNPGSKIIVRRITFANNNSVIDSVLRREMRQFEGAPYSKSLLERSKERLQRLTYLSEVSYTLDKVPGISHLVDVTFTVQERQSGNFSFQVGYSQANRLNLNFSLSRDNFVNTGDSISLSLGFSQVQQQASASYRISYFTEDGIDFITSISTSKINVAKYSSTVSTIVPYLLGSSVFNFGWSIPITEYSSFTVLPGYKDQKLSAAGSTSDQFSNYVLTYGNTYKYLTLGLSYSHDTRNRTLFPDIGSQFSYNFSLYHSNTNPSYLKHSLDFKYYQPLGERIVLLTKHSVTQGLLYSNIKRNQYGEKLDELPIFDKEYLGGISNLRAYEPYGLGPKDVFGNSIGGDFSLYSSLEIYFDPKKPAIGNAPPSENPLRIVAFIDAGNLSSKYSTFNFATLRYDIGIGMVWVTPIGPLLFSYAKPLKNYPEDKANIQEFQFSIGSGF